jgi:hypothetical protein
MRKILVLQALALLLAPAAFAGGIKCRQCPPESNKCQPICRTGSQEPAACDVEDLGEAAQCRPEETA